MKYPISENIRRVHFPPISEVQGWIAEARESSEIPLLDLCQAVPDYPPAPSMTAHMAGLLQDPLTCKYTPDEGLPAVRESICGRYRRKYGAIMDASQLCLTAGASQAFWLAMVTLCSPGDEVIVQVPYYFDYPMAMDILGIRGVYAPFIEATGGLPSVEGIAALISPRTRAILIVSPSNPTGVVTPPETLAKLYRLAERHDIALILDETYSDFIPCCARPHELFTNPSWGDHFIHIMSFGKSYALTGYRAGMLAASQEFVRHALKAQDTMVVCQPRIAQEAIRFGVENLDDWVDANRKMMEKRHDTFRREFTAAGNPFQLVTSGTFFAWVRHPFRGLTGREAARRLVFEAGLLTLPGEVFGPGLTGYLRLAFGNLPETMIPEAIERFRKVEC